ncbi:MAG TPA: UDP-N-acetylglucosamine 2-epimerase (non-hydrolyzing) [Myxococcales bacterium]|nr:UDP-N-acetylglucosamine 2-epimerase (non-hydrolyzing) [Myxococcales bacterium]
MKRVAAIFGTRPEAIKMMPVVAELDRSDQIDCQFIATAQHREMLDQVIGLFERPPNLDLNLMKPGQTLAELSARLLTHLDQALEQLDPDLVLVHGDTTTSAMAGLAAFYRQIPVGHVEAGLRTGDLSAPFPEEFNRILTGRLARWHYAPTTGARDNLVAEGTPLKNILVTGNTVIDALHQVSARLDRYEGFPQPLPAELGGILSDSSRLVLVTGHRRENFGEGFLGICQGLKRLAQSQPKVNIVYPVHLNPRVKEPVHELLGDISNVYLIPPLDYLPFVALMRRSDMVLTDSGGIQEEAPGLGKPVLVMREKTERPEALAAGTVRLVGTDPERIVNEALQLLEDPRHYAQMSEASNPYGDGLASGRIRHHLESVLIDTE